MNSKSRLSNKKHSRKKKMLKRGLLVFLLVFLSIVTIGGYFAFKTIEAANSSYSDLNRGNKSDLRDSAVDINKEPFSVLLIGVEDYASGGKGGRADTLMVATMNPEDKTIKLLSIPRDTQVEIFGTGEIDKINHSYNNGKDSTVHTIENFLNIPIDYYATVNFESFKDTIDHLGGITVDVPFDFWEKSDVDNHKIYFTKGKMTLDGEEALAFARMRKRDPLGDFGRNDRQKEVVKAVIEKVVSPSSLLKLDDLSKVVADNVETNFRITDALALAKIYSGFNISSIETLKLEGENSYVNNIYYFVPNPESIESIQENLKNHLDSSSVSTNQNP